MSLNHRKSMYGFKSITLIVFVSFSQLAQAYENDVHFGLTKWLALQTGFTEQQADTIALGNQRSDSGVMDTIQLVLEYACLGKHTDASQIVQSYHFAGAQKSPASSVSRAVEAGSKIARGPVGAVLTEARQGRSDVLLLKLGQALHLLQDSWAYQGVPSTPDFLEAGIQCDSTLAWAAPIERGGWNSHQADWMKEWPEDVAAMAQATYQVLTGFPPIAGASRTPVPWATLRQSLPGLVNASTKSEKQHWFNQQGVHDTNFLDGLTLPDGKDWVYSTWNGRRLPPLKSEGSSQFDVDLKTRSFFDSFFAQWLKPVKVGDLPGALIDTRLQKDLYTRLKMWRLKDHGSVAKWAHAKGELSKQHIQAVDALGNKAGAFVRYDRLTEAFFPLLQQGPGVSPLLPYVIHSLPDSKEGNARAIAVTKLRHLPYDELGLVAEHKKDGWKVVMLLSAVSH